MSAPQLGIGLRGDRVASDYGRLARLAEDMGFDVVTVFADLGYAPPLQPLLEIALATDRVMLGPSCLNPYTTHPVEIAGQVAALDAVSRGRAYLGLAKGAWLESIGVQQPRPVRAIKEAAQVVRMLLNGDTSGYHGELFMVEPGFRLHQPPMRPEVPLLIGTWSELTAALAGEIADELKVGGSANPNIVPLIRMWTARGAMRAGRAADETGIVLGAVTVVDQDREAARERARAAVAMYFEVVAPLDPTVQLPDGLVIEMRRLLRAGDARAAGRLIPDDLLDRFAFSGTPEEIARQVRTIFDSGARRVEFGAPFGIDLESGLRLLGERVVPQFR